MPTSINYPSDARGKWSLPVLLVLIALAVVSFLVPTPFKAARSKPNKEKLISEMRVLLREGKFEHIYEQARDNIRLGVTREKFVRRMSVAVAKLRAIDEGLNFSRDKDAERTLPSDNEGYITAAILDLEGNGKAVTMLVHWDGEGKFYNLTVSPKPGTPDEYTVHSVSHMELRIGGQLVED